MRILHKLIEKKQRKKMKSVEKIEKKIVVKSDELTKERLPQIGQFPNSEIMARQIKAKMVKKAQEEFALVMKQLADSKQIGDMQNTEMQKGDSTDDLIKLSLG